jgi:hypothetical protein
LLTYRMLSAGEVDELFALLGNAGPNLPFLNTTWC